MICDIITNKRHLCRNLLNIFSLKKLNKNK